MDNKRRHKKRMEDLQLFQGMVGQGKGSTQQRPTFWILLESDMLEKMHALSVWGSGSSAYAPKKSTIVASSMRGCIPH